MAIALKRWRFTVDDYHRMAEVGILTEDDRVELLDSEIVEMTPIGSDHAGHVKRLMKMPLYARAGLREVWLVDLTIERVEVYREPTTEGYRQIRVLARGQPLEPRAFPDLALNVDDLLG